MNATRASTPLTLIGLFAAGWVCALLFSCSERAAYTRGESDGTVLTAAQPERASSPTPHAAFPPPRANVDAQHMPPAPAVPTEARSQPAPSADKVAKWVTDATGDDPKPRTEAIAALANAPKSDAVPVLQRVLTSGSSDDRQLALTSLRALAKRLGDADGSIHGVLREAIYHGDDDTTVASAQSVLADIERDSAPSAP